MRGHGNEGVVKKRTMLWEWRQKTWTTIQNLMEICSCEAPIVLQKGKPYYDPIRK